MFGMFRQTLFDFLWREYYRDFRRWYSKNKNFSNSGCTYCDLCAISCQNGVLNIEDKKQIEAKIEIDILTCLSWQNTMCFSCKDPCLENAIDFLGMFRPTINQNCTSCGFCIKVCPTNAIKIA